MMMRRRLCLATFLLLAACHGTVFVDGAPDGPPPEPCEPGVVEVCGVLPAALDGVGACQLGERVCPADGKGFLACSGEVLPTAEDCTTAADETCTGEGACVGQPDWAAVSQAQGTHVGYGVVAQADGSLVVVGSFEGDLDLGGHALHSDERDAFIIKLAADGTPLWSLSAGGNADARAVAVNAANEIVVAGGFSGQVNFGPQAMNSQGAQSDIYALRISQDGEVLSQRRYGSSPTEYVSGMTVAPDGATVIVGGSDGASDVGAGKLDHHGEGDVLLIHLNPDHSLRWARSFGGSGWDYGHGVAVNQQGHVAVAVSCTSPGTGAFGDSVSCDEGGQAIVMTFDGDGAHRWTRHAGGEGPDQARSVAPTSDGHWVVGGLFSDTLDFGEPLIAEGGYEGYISVLGIDGEHIFSRRLPSPSGSNNFIKRLRVDAADNIVLYGSFRGTLELDDKVHENPDGTEHLFVAKLTPDGASAWSRDFGDGQTQRARDLAVGWAGDVVITGDYAGQLDFGNAVVAPPSEPVAGPNLFVAHFTP